MPHPVEAREREHVVGASKWDLDTPALCVDLAKLEQNLATMRDALAGTGVASRPHAKSHKCPAIAKRQLAYDAIGICTAKLSEAEVFWANGIAKILMTTSNVSAEKIRRAMELRQQNPDFIQAVDQLENARDLDEAARRAGIVADVVIDVAIGTRSGVPPGDQAVSLAEAVDSLKHLKLRGLISYDGAAQHIMGFTARHDQTLKRFEASVETFDRMARAGLSTEIFSGGGTGTYNILSRVPGVTDVQVGSYVFMDCQYLDIGGKTNDKIFDDFAPSLTVVATVLNTYFPNSLTTDAGAKALTLNKPGPWVIGEAGFDYNASSDEFGVIRYETSRRTYKVGDKIELIVPHCDPVVNLYDRIYAIRHEKVEDIWPISARGCSQ
jgi:3-hydroxy-D-aspartate aldolase